MPIVRNIAQAEAAFAHADWVEVDGEMVERYRQAAAAERADTFQIPEFPDMPQYQNAVCRGSFALGSACKHCEKCLAELEAMRGFGAKSPLDDVPYMEAQAGGYVYDSKTPLPQVVFTPNPNVHQGLPVAGYKKEQPQWAVDLVNVNKGLEEAVLRQLDHLKTKFSADVDQRQVALARTKLEEAFYHANRAVFQPQRILEGPVSDQADAVLRAVGSNAALSVEALQERNR